MSTHQLKPALLAKHQNNEVSVLGARFLRLNDEFNVNANGSVIGDSFGTRRLVILSVRVGVQWVNERQRWRIQTDARFVAGYNIANWNRKG